MRCRACGAAVPQEAQWCTLCFADLRPAPVQERVSVPTTAAPAAPAAPPSASPAAGRHAAGTPVSATQAPQTDVPAAAPASAADLPVERPAVVVPPRPASTVGPALARLARSRGTTATADRPASVSSAAALAASRPSVKATWPCPRCGASVPISLDMCQDCGAGFLSGAAGAMATRLPLVGDVGRMSQTQRLLVGIVIALVVTVLLVVVAALGGKFL